MTAPLHPWWLRIQTILGSQVHCDHSFVYIIGCNSTHSHLLHSIIASQKERLGYITCLNLYIYIMLVSFRTFHFLPYSYTPLYKMCNV